MECINLESAIAFTSTNTESRQFRFDIGRIKWEHLGVDTASRPLKSRLLFTGDTAWFDDLASIGEQYGPFDMAAIPIGAYAPRDFMKYNHVNEEEQFDSRILFKR